MSGDEGTTATNNAATPPVGSAQMQQSSLPNGTTMPKPLNLDNVAANWKKFKRAWDNYAVVVRLQRFDKEYKTATFLFAIGEEALEIYDSLFQALCQCGRLKKPAGEERGLVEKEGAPSPFHSRIPPVADPACRPLAFSIVFTDREPGTG